MYWKLVWSLSGKLVGLSEVCLECCWLGSLKLLMGELRNDAWVLSVAKHFGLKCVWDEAGERNSESPNPYWIAQCFYLSHLRGRAERRKMR